MHGLQPIAQIRQRTRGDRRKRINKIALGKRSIERVVFDAVERITKVGHERAIATKYRLGERPVSPEDQ